MKKETQKKLERLEKWFAKQPGSIVAFSGGVDSSLLLFLARKLQGRDAAIGVISDSLCSMAPTWMTMGITVRE